MCGGHFRYDQHKGCITSILKGELLDLLAFVLASDTTKSSRSPDEAERHLTLVRAEEDRGTFDQRDYAQSNPLGFTTLAKDWLKQREGEEIKRSTFLNCRYEMKRAMDYFGDINVKLLQEKEIEDFIRYNHLTQKEQPISSKAPPRSLKNLSQFMRWVCRREKLRLPVFPPVGFTLGYRNVVDADTQARILET